MKNRFIFYISALLTGLSTTLPAQQKNISFTDITSKAGIDFLYTIGDDSYKNIIESSGSGITIFDYNNDGLVDIFMMNGTWLAGISDPDGKKYSDSHNVLYKNNGDGTFTDVTEKAGLKKTFWSMAAGAADVDNDGDQDLYLLNYGPNVFYRNNGDGTFTDITRATGLAGPAKLNGFTKWSIGVSWFDYNRDGRLDALVGNFLAFDPAYFSPGSPDMMPSPTEYKGQASMLYIQQADGKFTDITEKAGLYYPNSKCMGFTVFDYDYDGDIDIFQANDHHLNYLFRNDQGMFTETAISAGVAANSKGKGTGSMHGALGDVDGDGLIDILVSDLDYGALYKNMGRGIFTDIIEKSGVAAAMNGRFSWGAALFDYDNDGDPDIIAANGNAEELILQNAILLDNDGKGNFRNVGPLYGSYFNEKRSGRGLVTGDIDNDGDLDVIISHVDKKATPVVLRNDGGNENNWTGITLKGKNGQAEAIGARVTISAGGKKQVIINQWSTSYLSNNDQRMHSGLGKAVKIEQIDIIWADGSSESFKNIPVNRYVTIIQGKGVI